MLLNKENCKLGDRVIVKNYLYGYSDAKDLPAGTVIGFRTRKNNKIHYHVMIGWRAGEQKPSYARSLRRDYDINPLNGDRSGKYLTNSGYEYYHNVYSFCIFEQGPEPLVKEEINNPIALNPKYFPYKIIPLTEIKTGDAFAYATGGSIAYAFVEDIEEFELRDQSMLRMIGNVYSNTSISHSIDLSVDAKVLLLKK